MSNCTQSCKTQDHESYGECMQSNMPMFMGVNPTKTGWDQDKVKKDERELKSYYSAIKQGVRSYTTLMTIGYCHTITFYTTPSKKNRKVVWI